MANLLQTAGEWLADRMKEHGSNDVSIKRGGTTVTGIKAVLGKTEWPFDDGSGVIDNVETRDFLIMVADYDFGGGPVEPVKGDQIIEALQGVVYTRTVSTPANVKPCRHDGYGKMWRIHTEDRQGA